MIGVRIDKSMFFDRAKVLKAGDRATRKVLGHFGGLVRKAAIRSIPEKPPRSRSSPGQPPHSHMSARRRRINRGRKAAGKKPIRGGFKGLRHILFAYEPARRSVVIGPASNRSRSITIPEILEYGKLEVQSRPFMGPAFEKEKAKLPALWAGSVK